MPGGNEKTKGSKMTIWIWGIKHLNGDYRHAEGVTIDNAVTSLGWSRQDVKRYMPIRDLSAVKTMSQEAKNACKAKQAERKALRSGKA